MTSKIFLAALCSLLVTKIMVVRSAPVEISNSPVVTLEKIESVPVVLIKKPITSGATDSGSQPSADASPVPSQTSDIKRKRDIGSYDSFDESIDDGNNDLIKNKLDLQVNEKPITIYENMNKSFDTGSSKMFSDMVMNPNELNSFLHKVRDINFKSSPKLRNKRASSRYEYFGDTNPFLKLFKSRRRFVRSNLPYDSNFWYPLVYEPSIRSSRSSYMHEPPEWNRIYENLVDEDEDPIPFSMNDPNDEDDNEYEYYRQPFSTTPYKIPYDNLQSQQGYTTEDIPIVDDEDFLEERFATPYRMNERYF